MPSRLGGLAHPFLNLAQSEAAPPLRFSQGWEMFIRHSVPPTESLPSGMPKGLRRCYGGGYLHFITSSCYHCRPIQGTRGVAVCSRVARAGAPPLRVCRGRLCRDGRHSCKQRKGGAASVLVGASTERVGQPAPRAPFSVEEHTSMAPRPAAKVRILRFKNLPPFRHYRGLQNHV